MYKSLEFKSSSLHLGYACIWDTERQRTWSGTPFQLLKALEQQENTVPYSLDCALSPNQTFFYKIFGLRYRLGQRFSLYRFMPPYLSAVAKRCSHLVNSTSTKLNAVIQIGDLAILQDIPTYSYQDLTVHYILNYLHKTGKPLPMFTMYKERELMRRWEYQQRYYENCTGIFTMSDWLKNYLVTNSIVPAHKIHTVHAGTNVPQQTSNATAIEPATKTATKMILFVGRDFERKGGDIVVEAFLRVRKEYSTPVRLVIAGPKTWQSCYPASRTIPEGIDFLGDADYTTLRSYFAKADVFCMPSRFEAFGIVFAEALALGVPCIGRHAYAMPEVITHGDNGYLLDANAEGVEAAQKLAELIMTTFENDTMRTRVHSRRAETAQYFSWNRVAEQMVSFIRQ